MPIIRCSEQKRQTLEAFYQEWVSDDASSFSDIGTSMLNVLKFINDAFQETTIYGLTSHAHLLLLNSDSALSPQFVSIVGRSMDPDGNAQEYYIKYLMKTDNQPWPDARVEGRVTSFDELKKYIIIAMTECNGWPDSDELKRLYGNIKEQKQ